MCLDKRFPLKPEVVWAEEEVTPSYASYQNPSLKPPIIIIIIIIETPQIKTLWAGGASVASLSWLFVSELKR